MLTEAIEPDKIAIYEHRKLCHVSEREQVLLNFIRNQLNRCHKNRNEVQVAVKVSERGISWQIIK